MKKFKKVLSILLICMLVASLSVGCGKQGKDSSSDATTDGSNKDVTDSKDNASVDGKITDKPVKLTYWSVMSEYVTASAATLAETELYKELKNRTGVEIEFLHPPVGQDKEQFNLMIASDELPDLIEYTWLEYPGGPEKALEDGVIVELNDLIDKNAPNLKKILDSDETIDKSVKTDSGKYYMFPFLRGDESLMVWCGPIMRKDWLDELGLEVPTTIDEWHTTLTAFKEKKGATAPYSFLPWHLTTTGNIMSAFGTLPGFYQENGEIKYGPIQPEYKDYLAEMSKWYGEGLLDPDYSAQDGKSYDAKITGGKTGAFIAPVGGGMGRYLTMAKDQDPKFDLVGVPYPTLKKGDKPIFGQKDFPLTPQGLVAITPACKEKEIAAKWLDYGYSEEGHMLFNFGIEGESYEMVDNYPKYTENITKNPDGLSFAEAMAKYARACYNGPFVQDKRYFEQYTPFESQLEAVKTWSEADDKMRIPSITPTPEESEKLASIMNEVSTYVSEMELKFIMGQVSLNDFDKYVEDVKKMGIEDAIKIEKDALERFNNR